MRVVLIGSGVLPIPPRDWGAVERAIDGLSRGLRSLGVDVLIMNRDGGGQSWKEYPFALGVPRRLRGLPRDIVHVFTPVVANRLLLAGERFVYTSHSRHWTGASGARERFGFWLERRACARATRTVALNGAVATSMRGTRPPTRPDRLRVIPNGVDLDRFAPRWDARQGNGLLGVGAIHPRKRWELAVRMLERLPGAHLTLAGPWPDPSYARRLLATPGSEGRLALTGPVGDAALARLYAENDLLIHPSVSELQSITVLEAMASGLPVLGTDVLSSEVPDPDVGQLLPRELSADEQVERWAALALELLADSPRRRRMGEAARRRAEEHYGWGQVAKATLDLYREVREEPPR